jgi:diguanylate cyclase (GGDEF)-like protein
MLRITREELNATIQQLEQAIKNHEEWFESLNRQMVCRLTYDRRNTREDAHRECQFGQWLYLYANAHVRNHPAFDVIEREHCSMHQSVARMLISVTETGKTMPEDYDRFSISMQRLRLEINTLKRELETTYYNLDGLTGANSRIGMLTHLSEQMELVKRGAQHFCIAMLDMDHFKQVNDTLGHLFGDQVLIKTVHHILNNIRIYDRLYRYGGEEFLLSMPHTNAAEAMSLVERLREGIKNIVIKTENNESLQITVSFGVFEINSNLLVEDAIRRADQALYAAKHLGRNCSQLWNLQMTDAKLPHT